MFDLGGWEFLLIVVLGIIIIGPKELPGTIRTINSFVRRAREMAREFQWGMEEIAREADLDKVAKEITGDSDPSMLGYELKQEIENTIDPDGQIRDVMKDDADGDAYDWTPELEEIDGGREISSPGDGDAPVEQVEDDPETVAARGEATS